MTGKEIFNEYRKKIDNSGSESDIYARDLTTFHFYASMGGEAHEFYSLLEKAESLGKKIGVHPKYDELLYSDVPVRDMILY